MPEKTVESFPRIIIAGTSGDSGKTLVSVGLLAGLRQLGYKLTAFKKGPDFIDPAWLNAASQTTVRNLDTYLIPPDIVYRTFTRFARTSAVNVIEGNRGLYDGFDTEGTHSTAELARLLKAPVILVCNVTKATRTVAAIIYGLREFDRSVNIAGVIINQYGGPRHKKIITEAIEKSTGIPVVGAIPRIKGESLLPARHLGLITPAEQTEVSTMIERLGKLISENVDLEKIVSLAQTAPELECENMPSEISAQGQRNVRIGYFSDSAFTFYYPENLESLQEIGAELIPISSLEDRNLPNIDALYIGGGFPETHVDKLAQNRELMQIVKEQAENGLPVYAECGGLIYLCRSLTIDKTTYPMTGFFDVNLVMKKAPQGHGYSLMEVDRANNLFPVGTVLKGHEFHYTTPVDGDVKIDSVLQVTKGSGFAGGRDGLVKNNVWAGYLHIHALGTPEWAQNFVKMAEKYKNEKNSSCAGGGNLQSLTAV